MADFRKKINLMRDGFFQSEERGGDFDDFRLMKKRIFKDCFDTDRFLESGRDQECVFSKSIPGFPDHHESNLKSNQGNRSYQEKDDPHSEQTSAGDVTGKTKSLENLYEKIRDLKSEFQHVEEKMRSAVESLPERQINRSDNPASLDTRSSRSWRKGPDFVDSRSCRSDGYYPVKISERLKDYSDNITGEGSIQVSSPSNTSKSSEGLPLTSGTPEYLTPVRGQTLRKDPPWSVYHPDNSSLKRSISPRSTSSDVSTPTHPFGRSTSPSSCSSQEASLRMSDFASGPTVRSPHPASNLQHSETYIQIPVVQKMNKKIEVGRHCLPSWQFSWQKVTRSPNKEKYGEERDVVRVEEEAFGYEATIYIYQDL